MEATIILLFFVFGAIIGSFLNVVILRYNTGGGIGGRSYCFACGNKIRWHDLVPLISFIFLSGRCRFCKSRISTQYILVESFTGLLFAATFWKFFSSQEFVVFGSVNYLLFVISLVVMAIVVIITAYDIKHKIIPDLFAVIFGVLSVLSIFVSVPQNMLFSLSGLAFYFLPGPLLALPFFLLWLISRGRWIGLGDAKLALGIGWFLGFAFGISAVIIGFWIVATVAVALLTISWLSRKGFVRGWFLSAGLKSLTIGSEMPLAPFLILGFLIVYFFKIDVVGLGSLATG